MFPNKGFVLFLEIRVNELGNVVGHPKWGRITGITEPSEWAGVCVCVCVGYSVQQTFIQDLLFLGAKYNWRLKKKSDRILELEEFNV